MSTEFQKLLMDMRLHMVAADDAIKRHGEKTNILLNMDFSIFQPFIYPKSSSLSPKRFGNYDFICREIMKTASNYRGVAKFSLVVSDLAFLELLDHTDRRHAFATEISESQSLSEHLATIAQRRQSRADPVGMLGTPAITNQLERAVAHLAEAPHRKKLQELISMMNSRVVRGLGDFFSPADLAEARNHKAYYKEVLGKIDQYRASTGSDRENANLNRVIDAWVVTISRNLHCAKEGHRVQFLGPPRLRQIYGDKTDALSCTVLSPFLELKSFQLASSDRNLKDEAIGYLTLTAEKVARVLRRVGDAGAVEDCLTADCLELRDVKNQLMDWYYSEDDVEDLAMQKQLMNLTEELAENPRGISDRFRHSADEHRKDAQSIVTAVPQILADEFLSEYELRDDRRIRQLVEKYT